MCHSTQEHVHKKSLFNKQRYTEEVCFIKGFIVMLDTLRLHGYHIITSTRQKLSVASSVVLMLYPHITNSTAQQ